MGLDLSAFDDVEIEASQKVSTKNKVDIVFVIDNSGSMKPVIDGVKKNIKSFANTLDNNQVDFRIGFVIHDVMTFYVKGFTNSTSEFASAVDSTQMKGYDEMTLVGIDRATEFDWDMDRHKFILHFTDETVATGYRPEIQISQLDNLISKIETKKIKFYHFGTHCEEYESFKRAKGTYYSVVDNFENLDFSELMESIGKSVSQASGTALQQGNVGSSGMLYSLSELQIAENIL